VETPIPAPGATPPRTEFRLGPLTCVCRPSLEPSLRRAYAVAPWVYEALRHAPNAELLRGRRPVVAGRLENGIAVVVKRLHHGGLLARLTGDRFLTKRRLVTSEAVADFLAARGVATPDVLFAAWRRSGPFVRGELGFERVDGGIDAADFLFARPGGLPLGWRERVSAIGRLVARLHALGVRHGDLNLMNFYLLDTGEVMILDLDKADLRPGSLPEGARRRNLARLERSVRKQGAAAPAADVAAVLGELRASYGAARA
jgi:tRNA A-37 threonylcarbamoyl transferase component Bud32